MSVLITAHHTEEHTTQYVLGFALLTHRDRSYLMCDGMVEKEFGTRMYVHVNGQKIGAYYKSFSQRWFYGRAGGLHNTEAGVHFKIEDRN